ncbi:hypothetical protein NLU13_2647 [Sarocladium strictum]|uniref:NmrA-like domain-containing protein n=1 Tax=Sarocladium strictum TaxID=5046 RepID=A0AA39L914_SARSR|nr:hypothetical protein NLU13_2647 [Sarocladium strictum]
MTDSVLVLGTGELGLAVLESLANQPSKGNIKLSVLLRPSTTNSTAPLQALGIASQSGDVVRSSISELATIFRNYDLIVSCNGMGLPSGTQLKLLDTQFGMDHDVVGLDSSQDPFDEQLDGRGKLRAQHKTEWTVIYTWLFMRFLILPEFGVVDLEQKIARALGSWDKHNQSLAPFHKIWARDTFGTGKGVAWPRDKSVNVARGIQMTGPKDYLKEM